MMQADGFNIIAYRCPNVSNDNVYHCLVNEFELRSAYTKRMIGPEGDHWLFGTGGKGGRNRYEGHSADIL